MGSFASSIDPTTKRGLGNIATGGVLGGSILGASGHGKNSSGGKGADAPSAPDFTAAVEAQSRGNHANQSTPWASSQWTEGPNGQWSQTLGLNGGLGQVSSNLMGQIASQGPAMTGDRARDQAITGAYNQATSRLDPQWSQRETGIRSQLANQGLDAGSQAYDAAMGNFGRDRNDAYTSAMADAIKQGTNAGAVTFEQNRAAAMQPYQQLASLQGLTGMPSNPGGANYLGGASANYQGALNQYGINQAGKNSTMSGMAQMAPMVLAAM